MIKSPGYASGVGLDLHIRTTRVDNPIAKYSFISGIAIKIGTDILEVTADGAMVINGDLTDDKIVSFSGHPLKRTLEGTKKRIVVYELNLAHDNETKLFQIRANTRTGMLFADANGFLLPDSVGLMGNPAMKDTLMARDGVTDLAGYWNAFGEEWQVQSNEPKLFQEHRTPQHPSGCRYEKTGKASQKGRRRLLADSGVDIEVATKACAKWQGYKKDFCIEDVMVTGDTELAKDSFYH